ncbi:hypothetical protein ES703_84693 [subsurface metagenome]
MKVGDILVLNIQSSVALAVTWVKPRVVQHPVDYDGIIAVNGRITKELEIELCRTTGRCSIVRLDFEPGPHRTFVCLPSLETRASAGTASLHRHSAVNLSLPACVGVHKLKRGHPFRMVLRLVNINAFTAKPVVLVHNQRNRRDRL